MREGVTTLEAKSGYGLSAEDEARCLRVVRRLGRELPLTVRSMADTRGDDLAELCAAIDANTEAAFGGAW